jgi:hypothetical protein
MRRSTSVTLGRPACVGAGPGVGAGAVSAGEGSGDGGRNLACMTGVVGRLGRGAPARRRRRDAGAGAGARGADDTRAAGRTKPTRARTAVERGWASDVTVAAIIESAREKIENRVWDRMGAMQNTSG